MKIKKSKLKSLNPLYDLTNKNEIKMFCNLILNMAKDGYTLQMVLNKCDILRSDFDKVYKKNKLLKRTIKDAEALKKGYGEELLFDMARGKITHSAQLVKLFMAAFYDITEEKGKEEDADHNKSKDINLSVNINKEEVKKELENMN